jgi:hypothetical protein
MLCEQQLGALSMQQGCSFVMMLLAGQIPGADVVAPGSGFRGQMQLRLVLGDRGRCGCPWFWVPGADAVAPGMDHY